MTNEITCAKDAVDLMPLFDYDKELIEILHGIYNEAIRGRTYYGWAAITTSVITRKKLEKMGFEIWDAWKYQKDENYISICWDRVADKIKKQRDKELLEEIKSTEYPSIEQFLKLMNPTKITKTK